MYYLNSRYYNPEIGRFISADSQEYLGQTGSLLSYNLYAYCENNPVNLCGPTGHGPVGAVFGAILGYGLGKLILPRVADKMGLKGKTRKWFVRGGTAAIALLGGYAGYYLGNAIASVYKAGGTLAGKANQLQKEYLNWLEEH